MHCQPLVSGYECKLNDLEAGKNQFTMTSVAAFNNRQAIGIDEISDRNIVYGTVQERTIVHLFVARLHEVKGKRKVAVRRISFCVDAIDASPL